MNGMYPIIRRHRRPLVEEPAAPVEKPPVQPLAEKPAVPPAKPLPPNKPNDGATKN